MPRPITPRPPSPRLLRGLMLSAALVAATGAASSSARSQTVSAAPAAPAAPASPAASPSPNERLMQLVPQAVGDWQRSALMGARPGLDGRLVPGAEATFVRGDVRVTLQVSESGLRPPPPAQPVERRDDQGSERIYAENGASVRETVRAADGRTEVSLVRADGLVVLVQGFRTTPFELKKLALAVRPLPR